MFNCEWTCRLTNPGETIFPAASMILSAGCDLSVPTEAIVSPSISTEPLGTSSWLVPEQPTTTPSSIRIFMLVLPLVKFALVRPGESACRLLYLAAHTSKCCSYNATAEESPLLPS